MTAAPCFVEPDGVPPDVAASIMRALDRSPSCVVTLGAARFNTEWNADLMAHSPKVAGSNPAPATKETWSEGPFRQVGKGS